ncbi:hypothetical protein TWF281_004042 [Arthrobotrys megalospora]
MPSSRSFLGGREQTKKWKKRSSTEEIVLVRDRRERSFDNYLSSGPVLHRTPTDDGALSTGDQVGLQ